jgi:hypothetical protein
MFVVQAKSDLSVSITSDVRSGVRCWGDSRRTDALLQSQLLDPQRTLANRAGYDALRHGEIVVFEPDLSALVRRNGKARGRVSAISIVRKRLFRAAR